MTFAGDIRGGRDEGHRRHAFRSLLSVIMRAKNPLTMNLAPIKAWESARGLAQSKTLTRCPGALDHALASWSAPVLWRFVLRFVGRGSFH